MWLHVGAEVKTRLTFECPDGGGGATADTATTTTQLDTGACTSGGCGEEEGAGGVCETGHEAVPATAKELVVKGTSSTTSQSKEEAGVAAGEEEVTSSSSNNAANCLGYPAKEDVLQSDETTGDTSTKKADAQDQSNKGRNVHMNGEVGQEEGVRGLARGAGSTGGLDSGSVRLRSCSAGAAVGQGRRLSVESGMLAHQHERLLIEKRRRRWSLNTPNNLSNLPQVCTYVYLISY